MRNMCLIYDFDISHFLHYGSTKGKHFNRRKSKEYVLQHYFISNAKIARHVVREYIIKYNLIPYKCELCGNEGVWNGQKIALELDHKNGKNNDHRLENLRWLCPNCHATTDTYRGRNLKKKNRINKVVLKSKIPKTRKIAYCKRCGKVVHIGSDYCVECAHFLQRRTDRPSRNKLKELIRTQSFRAIGRLYSVSDNTISKWCESYELPNKKKFIKNINDLDWLEI